MKDGFPLSQIWDGHNIGAISISEDGEDPQGQEIVAKYEKQWREEGWDIPVAYISGNERRGIAKNKNRGIRWFMEDPMTKDCDYLLMSDDDLSMTQSDYPYGHRYLTDALLEAHIKGKEPHILGYISWYQDRLTKQPFWDTFKIISENEYVVRCGGSQGVLLSFTRECIEKVGFFSVPPENYGFEHVNYSERINRIYGKCPDVFPYLKTCYRYFHCSNIPNNYDIPPEELEKNNQWWQKRQGEIYMGINLRNKKYE